MTVLSIYIFCNILVISVLFLSCITITRYDTNVANPSFCLVSAADVLSLCDS